jgi:RHS repeat-associated protein
MAAVASLKLYMISITTLTASSTTELIFCAFTYHFTGKERDSESGLDYFGARYYGSNMGRFMSPDWSSNPISIPFARIDNPQTLNLYGYVGNNPLRYFDPYGHESSVVCTPCSAIVNFFKRLFSGGGGSGGSGSAPSPAPAPPADPHFMVTSRIHYAPDYYSLSGQAGYAGATLSWIPKTNHFIFLPQVSSEGLSLMGTAGWSLSRRPESYGGENAENYLTGKSLGGCAGYFIAGCGGYSPGGGGFAGEIGGGFGVKGGSGAFGYAFDLNNSWDSVVGGMWDAMPVEDPMAAMPSNGAVGIGSGLIYNPCMDAMDCH